MQFDFFSPSLKLAIEFHGRQHYEDIDYWMYHSSTISQRRRDEEKRKSCKEHGITLIEINHQEWNHKSTSSELFRILKSHKLKLQSTKKISISSSSCFFSFFKISSWVLLIENER